MIRVGLALLAICAAAGGAHSANAQSNSARIDSIFSFANDTTPGCAVAAWQDGKSLFVRGYGVADLEHDVAITTSTPFYLASVSKQFTAGAIALLVLDGKLTLDDNVRKWVPEVPDFGTPITIRHLLHHTSGLRDYLTLYDVAGLDDFPISNADFLATLGRQRKLNFTPGARYSYSNTGYVLLSIIVERASGQSLRRFADERIFTPLGMTATQFRDDHRMLIRGRAVAYGRNADGYYHAVPYFDVVGDGGLFSSADDLARWEENFVQPRVGGAEWLKLMAERGRLNDGTQIAYGAGLGHGPYRGEPNISHGGGLGGYNTFLMRMPGQRYSIAVLCNTGIQSANALALRVTDVLLGDVLAPVTAVAGAAPANASASKASMPDSTTIARATGVFFNDELKLVRRLIIANDSLYYSRSASNRSSLVPLGGGQYAMTGTAVIIRVAENNDTIRFEDAGGPPIVMERVPPPAAGAGGYAGEYFSPELQVTWRVTAQPDGLTFKPDRGADWRVQPVFADAFGGAGFFIEFVRAANGRVIALEASAGQGAREIRFERRDP